MTHEWPKDGTFDETITQGSTGLWNDARPGQVWMLRRMDIDNKYEQPYSEIAITTADEHFVLYCEGLESGVIRISDPTITRALRVK